MKKTLIIIAIIVLLPLSIFWFGNFHFSNHYFIGRDIPFEKISKLNVDFWKYSDEYHVTDFFDNNMIKNDTLYIAGRPEAKVIKIVHRYFLNDYILTIQSFDGQETGSYVSK